MDLGFFPLIPGSGCTVQLFGGHLRLRAGRAAYAGRGLLSGFTVGGQVEENPRRAMPHSRGDPVVFVRTRISTAFLAISAPLIRLASRPKRATAGGAPR